MFGQLLSNKNKIATVWRDTYYAKFDSKFWNLNMPLKEREGGRKQETTDRLTMRDNREMLSRGPDS
jgi:hypothetical protein